MKKICFFIALFFSIQIVAQTNIEVVNIENKAVQDYLRDARATYSTNNNYSVSVVAKYNDTAIYGHKLHWPAGKYVSWNTSVSIDNINEIRITVSENPDYTNPFTFNPSDKNDKDFIIRNLLPNRIYYYKVEEFLNNGSHNILKDGVFRTEGQIRMIQVRNCGNVRDIGGWDSSYGGTIKYGKLYRSGSLNMATKEGKHDFVDNLGVRAELDLRYEVNQSHSSLGQDIDYDRRRHEAGTKGLTQSKHELLRDLKWIINKLKQGKNVDWHCAIGCDRCGLVSFLIEGLLGMSEQDLSIDFELSTFSLRAPNKRPRAHVKSMLDFIKKYGPADDLAKCFYNYWREIGMNTNDLDYFIDEMIDKSGNQGMIQQIDTQDFFELQKIKVPEIRPELKPYRTPPDCTLQLNRDYVVM